MHEALEAVKEIGEPEEAALELELQWDRVERGRGSAAGLACASPPDFSAAALVSLAPFTLLPADSTAPPGPLCAFAPPAAAGAALPPGAAGG